MALNIRWPFKHRDKQTPGPLSRMRAVVSPSSFKTKNAPRHPHGASDVGASGHPMVTGTRSWRWEREAFRVRDKSQRAASEECRPGQSTGPGQARLITRSHSDPLYTGDEQDTRVMRIRSSDTLSWAPDKNVAPSQKPSRGPVSLPRAGAGRAIMLRVCVIRGVMSVMIKYADTDTRPRVSTQHKTFNDQIRARESRGFVMTCHVTPNTGPDQISSPECLTNQQTNS